MNLKQGRGRRSAFWLGLGLACALGLIAAIALMGFFGQPSKARIVSGSMAPFLIGPHWRIDCTDCGFGYRCSLEQSPSPPQVVCPMCGRRQGLPKTDAAAGDAVIVDATALQARDPDRWEVIAFAAEEQTDYWETKRVLGLPGENVLIKAGDVWVNNAIASKSLQQFRDVAVLVHDSRFQSKDASLGPRWRVAAESGWKQRNGQFAFSAQGAPQTPQWLEYAHWLGMASPLPRNSPSPILDNYSENQNLSRELHAVSDLLFDCTLMLGPNAVLSQRLATRGVTVQGHWNLEKRSVSLQVNQQIVTQKTLNYYAADLHLVTLAVVDGQAFFEIQDPGGAPLATLRCNLPPADLLDPSSSPAALTISGDSAQIDGIQLHRDLHYLEPNATAGTWSAELGDDEYLVLGDNAPVSIDSRQHGPVKRSEIIGVVKRRARRAGF